MHILGDENIFPSVENTDIEGLLAVGGDLSPSRLLLAYQSGIFPWYEKGQPILWWSPDPRMVLYPEQLKVSKSMRQLIKKGTFSVTYNQCFEKVIRNCAVIKRDGQLGTWITEEMITAYMQLHQQKIATSVEVWQDEELVGGLYGIYLRDKHIFCGESMFAKVSNASKYGFISLVKQLAQEGVKLIDCQVYTPHLESLGAYEIDRELFIDHLHGNF
ncbi:leucyl/phenylalanyl-tRNA--protein transferase [Mesonia aestuariivivens]|uniref:Leucyl/phenylalanyl-tRNA--protein transferase n=1 Tax=Mesonia aestuariivivens TaxID=2796128 RepID=A0ABS6VXX8_9FLAO|nr:leucyl/phenylalanyl-tRNA--protein transferase [Mesonia aestuariivivens]MBW2960451.1 leucyl/phenylalanyl-tRNA--protein transferase [Mesonia aestuariivivens]